MRIIKYLKRRQAPRAHQGTRAPQETPLSAVLPSGTFYQDLDALPMDRFIKVVTTGELRHLVIAGDPDLLEVQAAWTGLFLDYLDALKATEGRKKYEISNEIAILSSRISRFEVYLELLQLVYADEIRDAVRALGFEDLELDPEDPEDYFATLQGLKNRTREWRLDLQLRKIDLEEVLKEEKEKAAGGQALDQQYFLRILDRIATYKRVPVIRAAEITVAEFCAMVLELIDYTKRK